MQRHPLLRLGQFKGNIIMKTLYTCFGLLVLVVGPFWYGWIIYDDLMHPELWDQQPLHDPRNYAPYFPAVTSFVLGVMWWAFRTESEIIWRSKFFGRFLEYVKWKECQGQWNDASKALEVYRDLRQWELRPGR